MKKYLIFLIAFSLALMPFYCISAVADESPKEALSSIKKYKFNVETRTLQEINELYYNDEVGTYISGFSTDDKLVSPSYVPEGLTADPPESYSPYYLMGNWTAINPATDGQHRNTVHIRITAPNGRQYIGSGFMIGPSAVATTAHTIYNTAYGGDFFASSAIITPARADSSAPYGSASASQFVVYNFWTEDQDVEYDWAIIELNSNIGDSVGYLGLQYQSGSYAGKSVMLNGYPGQVNGVQTQIMYQSNGSISNSYDKLLRSTNTNVDSGMSGGPVYYHSETSGYTAIALIQGAVSTSSGTRYNRFVRITSEVYNDFVAYRNIRV